MKNLSSIVLACVASTALSAQVTLLTETFSYPDGALVGTGGWAAHSGAGNKAIQITSGAIGLTQSSGSGEDVNVPIGHTLGAGEMFTFEFDVTVNGTGDADTVYFAHFKDGGTGFNSRIFVTAPNTASSNFTFGLGESSSSAATFATDFDFGSTYTLSGGYDFDTGISTLSVDGGVSSISSAAQADPGEDLSAFAFRQAGGNTTMIIDNLEVALVPEPSSFAFLGGLVGLGLIMARRRR